MELASRSAVTGRVPVSTVGKRPALVAGVVRRLVFVPDGGEGRLVATIDDGTGTLDAIVPRIHARDWAPGVPVAAEGEMDGGVFVVRAYLPGPADDPGTWIEVAPLPAP